MDIAALTGRVVATAKQQLHVVSGEPIDEILFVRLEFHDGTGVRFGCDSDGQSLGMDEAPLEAYEMPDTRSVVVQRPFHLVAVDEPLDVVEPLIDDDDLTFGVLLGTRSGQVFVFNWGDTLYAEVVLPEEVRREVSNALPL